ncbi:hypothetical protein Micbo1qcDRAFT_194879 [Microdochium bolleyi]|uniref:Glycerate dehydrogenase n=1 Tax=Microdochium bolleyi TaxID=196109 RepID=A0A136J447_9PEZI|nr:hypothetical protein Micbo1qcDRAFT_194879 [Microdochium bolleyi]
MATSAPPPPPRHAHDPAQKHFIIAALEASFVPVPSPLFPPDCGFTYELRSYPLTTPEQVPERIADADIAILSVLALPRHLLAPDVCPRLKHIAVVASGTDQVDKQACRERGIVVSNTPHCNTTSVAEHVIASYFATRRSLLLAHDFTQDGQWGKGGNAKSSFVLDGRGDGKPPRTCGSEVLGIVGYGGVGKKVEALARALGMTVLISGRKGDDPVATVEAGAAEDAGGGGGKGDGRTPFDTLLRTASVVVLCCPRTPETLDLISTRELSLMPPHALLINVARGGVVDEPALLAALRARQIAGYATDVFLTEPAHADNSALVLGKGNAEGLNILTTPHIAWCAEETNDAYNRALLDNLRGWLLDSGKPRYPVLSYD